MLFQREIISRASIFTSRSYANVSILIRLRSFWDRFRLFVIRSRAIFSSSLNPISIIIFTVGTNSLARHAPKNRKRRSKRCCIHIRSLFDTTARWRIVNIAPHVSLANATGKSDYAHKKKRKKETVDRILFRPGGASFGFRRSVQFLHAFI